MEWAIASVAVVAVLAIVFYARFRYVSRKASFEAGLRKVGATHVAEGFARYSRGRLDWYKLASFRYRPSRYWTREELADLEIMGRLTSALGNELMVISVPGRSEELLMRRGAYSGLRSWLEAAPPQAASTAG